MHTLRFEEHTTDISIAHMAHKQTIHASKDGKCCFDDKIMVQTDCTCHICNTLKIVVCTHQT